MQEEIIKHSNKIKDTLKNSSHSLKEKIKELLTEIFIIVFAVTLSIWLHSWSEHRHQQAEVKEFITDLQDDLNDDIKSFTNSRENLNKNFTDFQFVLNLTKPKLDSIIKAKSNVGFNSTLSTTKINNGNYEGFKSSGKIGLIENKKLKKLILKYYQENAIGLIEVERYTNTTFESLLNFMSDHADLDFKDIVLMPSFKEKLKFHIQLASGQLEGYEESIKAAKELLLEIDKQKE